MDKLVLRSGMAGLALLCGTVAGSAQEFTAENGSSAKFYGQISPSYLSFDDGEDQISELVDNANSNSRVGFFLEFPFQNDTKLKFNFETALGFLQSNALTIDGYDQWYGWDESDLRKLELIYSGSFGTISAGQGSMTSDGLPAIDFSGTSLAGFSDTSKVAGAFKLRNQDGSLSSTTVKKVFNNLEGSRRFRLRYDSPTYEGFTFSVAGGEDVIVTSPNTYYDLAIRYAKTFGEVKFGAGIGYSVVDVPDADKTENILGSLSVLHEPTGLNFTLASGSVKDGGSYVYGKAGWIGDLIDAGSTAVAFEAYQSTDLGVDDSTGDMWGVMAVQKIDAYATEVYAGYREYDVAQPGPDLQTASSVMFGARWKF